MVEALTPPSPLTVTEWADAYRELPDTSAASGKYFSALTPYVREIMDALTPGSPWQRVVVMKGSQLGGSEAGHNWIGYTIAHAPVPMMVVYPTVTLAKEWSRDKLEPLISLTPSIRDRIMSKASRRRGNNLLTKRFPGGRLSVAGANVAATLRSREVCNLDLEEVDAYPPDVDGEGDPCSLAEKRMQTFGTRAKLYVVSTPTITGQSRVEKAFLEGDQRRFYVPCPRCGREQVLIWEQVRYEPEHPLDAWYECIHNGCRIENWEKDAMLPRGRWIASAPGDGVTASFHLPSLYTPNGWRASWGRIALEYEQVKADPERLKPWRNQYLALTWEDRTAGRPDALGLMARTEKEKPDTPWHQALPDGVLLITAGVDVQDDRIEVEIVGWGHQFESWSLGYYVIDTDPVAAVTWKRLDALLKQRFRRSDGRLLRVSATCIDSRYRTDQVDAFCRTRRARRVWPIMGMAGRRPIWELRPKKRNKRYWYRVGVDAAKDAVYGRLRIDEVGPGYCHFAAGRDGHEPDEEYFDGLTAEEKKFKRDKKSGLYVPFWYKPEGARNEPLDCRAYAYAALNGLRNAGVSLERAAQGAGSPEPSSSPSDRRPIDRHPEPRDPGVRRRSRAFAADDDSEGQDGWYSEPQ